MLFFPAFISLKALDEIFSSKNYVREFLRTLHPKWRAKVTAIEESKDLSSLALDELIDNLKVHEVIMKKDSEIYKGKKERVKSIALKAKKEFSDDETSTSERNFKIFFRKKGRFVIQPREDKKSFRQRDDKKGKSDRKCFRCNDLNHLIGECPKPPRNKEQKAFVEGSWSDSENEADDKTNEETFTTSRYVVPTGRVKVPAGRYVVPTGKDNVVVIEESLNMTFDESPPPTKLSPLVDDDVGEEEAIERK
ncbi:zf-CCHC domain-containing protein [Tanacetum coccineum]